MMVSNNGPASAWALPGAEGAEGAKRPPHSAGTPLASRLLGQVQELVGGVVGLVARAEEAGDLGEERNSALSAIDRAVELLMACKGCLVTAGHQPSTPSRNQSQDSLVTNGTPVACQPDTAGSNAPFSRGEHGTVAVPAGNPSTPPSNCSSMLAPTATFNGAATSATTLAAAHHGTEPFCVGTPRPKGASPPGSNSSPVFEELTRPAGPVEWAHSTAVASLPWGEKAPPPVHCATTVGGNQETGVADGSNINSDLRVGDGSGEPAGDGGREAAGHLNSAAQDLLQQFKRKQPGAERPSAEAQGGGESAPAGVEAKKPKLDKKPSSGPGSFLPDDGWDWKKYGVKNIQDKPYPRYYFRCVRGKKDKKCVPAADDCPARKQAERCQGDPTKWRVRYIGEHNHDKPPPRPVTVTIVQDPSVAEAPSRKVVNGSSSLLSLCKLGSPPLDGGLLPETEEDALPDRKSHLDLLLLQNEEGDCVADLSPLLKEDSGAENTDDMVGSSAAAGSKIPSRGSTGSSDGTQPGTPPTSPLGATTNDFCVVPGASALERCITSVLMLNGADPAETEEPHGALASATPRSRSINLVCGLSTFERCFPGMQGLEGLTTAQVPEENSPGGQACGRLTSTPDKDGGAGFPTIVVSERKGGMEVLRSATSTWETPRALFSFLFPSPAGDTKLQSCSTLLTPSSSGIPELHNSSLPAFPSSHFRT